MLQWRPPSPATQALESSSSRRGPRCRWGARPRASQHPRWAIYRVFHNTEHLLLISSGWDYSRLGSQSTAKLRFCWHMAKKLEAIFKDFPKEQIQKLRNAKYTKFIKKRFLNKIVSPFSLEGTCASPSREPSCSFILLSAQTSFSYNNITPSLPSQRHSYFTASSNNILTLLQKSE